MTIEHHIDRATILAFASGELDEAFSIVVSAHLAMCDQCREEVRKAEEIGGAFLEEESASLDDGAFDRLMNTLGDEEPKELIEHLPKVPMAGGAVPYPLQRVLGGDLDSIRWRRLSPGIRRADLSKKVSGGMLYALEIAPGLQVPEHGHNGYELTLVLKGAYCDHFGRFGPGDIADHDEDVEHQPVVEEGEVCVCIVASGSLLRYKSVLNRILQPIVGM